MSLCLISCVHEVQNYKLVLYVVLYFKLRNHIDGFKTIDKLVLFVLLLDELKDQSGRLLFALCNVGSFRTKNISKE